MYAAVSRGKYDWTEVMRGEYSGDFEKELLVSLLSTQESKRKDTL